MDILLSAVEVVRRDPEDLEGCETLIVANYQRNNWLKVGAALLVIHDTALFKKSGADSFSNYISTKADFGFGPRQALRLLAATKLAKIFPPTIALPTSERQVRALVGLEPRKAIKTWVKANLISQETGVPLTHRLVESVLSKDIPQSYRAACSDWRDYVHPDSEYYRTPHHLVSATKRLFGGAIDLDPCSDELAQVGVEAARFYSAEDDGLQPGNPWAGRVYVFPPVGMHGNNMLQGLFLDRAINEFKAGRVTEVVLLLKVAIGQKWFAKVFDYPHCFLADKPLKTQPTPPEGWGVPEPESSAAALMAATAALLTAAPSASPGGEGGGGGGGRGRRKSSVDEDEDEGGGSRAGPSSSRKREAPAPPADAPRTSRPRRSKATAGVAAAAAAAAAAEDDEADIELMQAPSPARAPATRTRRQTAAERKAAAAAAAAAEAQAAAQQQVAQEQLEQQQQMLVQQQAAASAAAADPMAAAAMGLGSMMPGQQLMGLMGQPMAGGHMDPAAAAAAATWNQQQQQQMAMFAGQGASDAALMGMAGLGLSMQVGMQMGHHMGMSLAPLGLQQGQQMAMPGGMPMQVGHHMGLMAPDASMAEAMAGMAPGMGLLLPGLGQMGMGQMDPQQMGFPGQQSLGMLPAGMEFAGAMQQLQQHQQQLQQEQQQQQVAFMAQELQAAAGHPHALSLMEQAGMGGLGGATDMASQFASLVDGTAVLGDPAAAVGQALQGQMLATGACDVGGGGDGSAGVALVTATAIIDAPNMDIAQQQQGQQQAQAQVDNVLLEAAAGLPAAVEDAMDVLIAGIPPAAEAPAPSSEPAASGAPSADPAAQALSAPAVDVNTAPATVAEDPVVVCAAAAVAPVAVAPPKSEPEAPESTGAQQLPPPAAAAAAPPAATEAAAPAEAPPAEAAAPEVQTAEAVAAAATAAAAATSPYGAYGAYGACTSVEEAGGSAAAAGAAGPSGSGGAGAEPGLGSQAAGNGAGGSSPREPGEVFNPRGTVVVYIGKNAKLFCQIFGEMGHIPGYNAWSR